MQPALGVGLLILVLALSITFHEFMHAYISYKLGDETAKYSGRLTLNPIAHIDPFATVLLPVMLFLAGLPVFGAAKPVPFNTQRLKYGDKGVAMVAIAGPLTNLALAIFISAWLRVVSVGALAESFFQLFVVVNIGFFVFNLIPFPPLDGSRVVYAFAPESLRTLMRQIEAFGLMGVVLFIFLLFPVLSPIIGGIITGLLEWLLPAFSLNSLR